MKRSMSFLRTILGRGVKNPGSQADAEKKKSINSKPNGMPDEGVVNNGISGPQPLSNLDANASEEHVFR